MASFKTKFLYLVLISLVTTAFYSAAANHSTTSNNVAPFCAVSKNPSFAVAFSPKQGAKELIIESIRNAKKSIYVAAYTFTSRDIANELIRAKTNGIDVRIVVDQRQTNDKHSLYGFFKDNDIAIRANGNYKIMHHKFMIFDGNSIELGSFNYTRSAIYNNAENVLVINDCQELAQAYTQQWLKLWNEAS
jgi:phosphatidylserine/phosphatidylglycerophosphate/cardiolipin synthase-like enzyme